MNIPDRLIRLIEFEPMSGCWLWSGSVSRDGYGKVTWENTQGRLAHRVIYALAGNELIAGLELDHKCRTRCCVNPDHLRQITHAENVRLTSGNGNQFKTHCPKGHPYEGDNLVVYPKPTGTMGRLCRTCRNLAAKIREKAKRDRLRQAKGKAA